MVVYGVQTMPRISLVLDTTDYMDTLQWEVKLTFIKHLLYTSYTFINLFDLIECSQ